MKMKGISPLLAAVILVALTISVAFIVSSAISGMAQKQAGIAKETAQASGAMLQVDTGSITCNNSTKSLQMVVKLLGTQTSAQNLTVILRVTGKSSVKGTYVGTINPGVNLIDITLNDYPGTGSVEYLSVSTTNPSVYAEYTSDMLSGVSCS